MSRLDRLYAHIRDQHAQRPYASDRCRGCLGRGFQVDRDGEGRACLVCEGHAAAGLFAVQLGTALVRVELNGETTSFRRAVATAIRAATLASLRVRRARPTEARVVYYAADGSSARCLYRVPVVVPGADPVAA
ncbi:MAG TPA: hypothetical protein VD866_06015 [Urbifossiella sp.]|nr:hypothetical protein [Urbifossiella sp.]